MSLEQIWIGIVRGAYYVPVALAFALAARQGRYLPIWIPECGMVAGYVGYFLSERTHLPLALALAFAILAGSATTLILHFSLFAGHVERVEPFPALLRGIGVIVVLDNAASLFTGGYSLAFTSIAIPTHLDGWIVGGVVALSLFLWSWVNHTRQGLDYRAISANRNLAKQYGLAVRRIDVVVLTFAGLLCSLGGIVSGVRFGLTPAMMPTTALKAVAVVVAVGSENLLLVTIGMLVVGVLESLCQARVQFSTFEPAVSYCVLAIGLVVHHLLLPWWTRFRARRRWRIERSIPEATG